MIFALLLMAAQPAQSADTLDESIATLEAMPSTDRTMGLSIEVQQLAQRFWVKCLITTRDHFIRSREPIDTIVIAVFASCAADERRLLRASALVARDVDNPGAVAAKAFEPLRRAWSNELTRYFVELRL